MLSIDEPRNTLGTSRPNAPEHDPWSIATSKSPAYRSPGSGPAESIGDELARLRLARRVQRIEQVLRALDVRRVERQLDGPVPRALQQAIAEFTGQLRTSRAQLAASQPARS